MLPLLLDAAAALNEEIINYFIIKGAKFYIAIYIAISLILIYFFPSLLS